MLTFEAIEVNRNILKLLGIFSPWFHHTQPNIVKCETELDFVGCRWILNNAILEADS